MVSQEGGGAEITVNSSLYAQPVYERIGFVQQSEPQMHNGVISVPMKIVLGEWQRGHDANAHV